MLKQGARLIWTSDKPPSSEFWDEWWLSKNFSAKLDTAVKSFSLEPLEKPLLRWMPKRGKIVEAGCGYGPVVFALRNRGYQIEGVEYGELLVNRVLSQYPDAQIRCEDVCNLKCPDGEYSGYISLGVMEHRYEGPEPYLREAFRVLSPKGIAFISVPYYDFLWRLRIPQPPNRMPEVDRNEHFFQWHYTRREFTALLKRHGFIIEEVGSYGVRYGALRSVPGFARLVNMRGGSILWNLLKPLESMLNSTGWMQYFVAMKP